MSGAFVYGPNISGPPGPPGAPGAPGPVSPLGTNISGRYYSWGCTAYASVLMQSTNLTFIPFVPMSNMTLASLAVIFGNTVSVAGSLTLGVYSDNAGLPYTKLVSDVYAFTSADHALVHVMPMSGGIVLTAGTVYWLAAGMLKPAGNVTMMSFAEPSTIFSDLIGITLASISIGSNYGYYSADVPGVTMPANVGALTINTSTSITPPLIFVGVA